MLTSYALLPRDEDLLREHDYHLVILDEAQSIKNPRHQARAQRAGLLKARAPPVPVRHAAGEPPGRAVVACSTS